MAQAPTNSSPPPAERWSSSCVRMIAAAIFLCTLALFSRSVICEFMNFDDQRYVYENQHVLGGFSAENVRWAM